MKNRFFHSFLLTVCLLAPLPSTAGSYNKMFVFGDSLSDSGNLATLAALSPDGSGPDEFRFLNDAPYFHGFTNGPTAVFRLANLLQVPDFKSSLYLLQTIEGTNFAVAGARAAGDEKIDLNTQVGAFLASLPPFGGKAPSDALYILFIGGNDIRDMRNAADLKTSYAILKKAKQNIHNNLSLLISLGAKHIMVVNSPNIGNLPETKLIAQQTNNSHVITKATLFTMAYNQALADTVKTIEKYTHRDLVLFDVFTFFNNIVKDSRSLLFSNAKDACYSSVAFDYNLICDSSHLDTFVYFDEIHPTQRVHERVGRAMFAVVPEAN
ncbi:MAG: SGNH/GDSL hydrolase family protein [Methylococcaceae bacterium]|nr:SGNH/GDSL hydrolase family protein [Methylococcaceae bacterium]